MSSVGDNNDAPISGTWDPEMAREWDERLDRLNDEVGAMQIQLAEKRKPWYRQTALIVSMASLLFSIVFNIWTRSTDAVTKSSENLQTIVAQLADIRAEEVKDALASKTDFTGYTSRAGLRNTKRIALLDHADSALTAAKNQVSAAILVTLGFEAAAESQYDKAEKYYQLGVQKSSPNTSEKMWALFDEAQLRLLPGSPLYNLTEGRQRYQQAVNELMSADDNARYQRGQVLARIAQLESLNPDGASLSQHYYDRALAEAKRISQLNPLGNLLIQFIAMAQQSVTGTTPSSGIAFNQTNTWLGQWKLKYPRNSSQVGNVTFVSGSAPNVIGAYVDVLVNGKLVEKEIGQVAILDDKRIRLDWNAQRSVPVPMQTAGYSILRASPVGLLMTGEQRAFGEDAVPMQLSR